MDISEKTIKQLSNTAEELNTIVKLSAVDDKIYDLGVIASLETYRDLLDTVYGGQSKFTISIEKDEKGFFANVRKVGNTVIDLIRKLIAHLGKYIKMAYENIRKLIREVIFAINESRSILSKVGEDMIEEALLKMSKMNDDEGKAIYRDGYLLDFNAGINDNERFTKFTDVTNKLIAMVNKVIKHQMYIGHYTKSGIKELSDKASAIDVSDEDAVNSYIKDLEAGIDAFKKDIRGELIDQEICIGDHRIKLKVDNEDNFTPSLDTSKHEFESYMLTQIKPKSIFNAIRDIRNCKSSVDSLGKEINKIESDSDNMQLAIDRLDSNQKSILSSPLKMFMKVLIGIVGYFNHLINALNKSIRATNTFIKELCAHLENNQPH